MKNSRKKPILLCILDGWGIGDKNDLNNAIARANTPNHDRFFTQYPNSQLLTSGLDVGLPDGQIGNSEVGHMTIGAGRVIFQDLPRINNAIADGSLDKDEILNKLADELKTNNKTLHLAGLLSDGGVHAHINHIIFLAKLFSAKGVKTVLHAFLDGRDVAQKSALKYVEQFEKNCDAKIVTISGRYFAMDRDKRWDRVQLAYDAIAKAAGEKFPDAKSAVENSYENDVTDEFVKPCVIGDYTGIENGDALLFCNFRADRAREISHALLDENFKDFAISDKKFGSAFSMTEYSKDLAKLYQVIFEQNDVKNSLPEILAKENMTQLRIAETEKYAHVTFFFSGGEEKEFPGEERILVNSPNVATYDLQPEMSAKLVGNKLREAISSRKFDFIIVNYANPDMVGHSGKIEAAIAACEVIDEQLGLLEKEILAQDGLMLISADHGNIECMHDNEGNPHTAHTTNPVPFILIGNEVSGVKIENGSLADIAPTIVRLMGIEQPEEMTGRNLMING